jgi:hypothetical protein
MSRIGEISPGRATADVLEPARLLALAAELDAAGGGCKVMAERTANRGSRIRHLARASACYGAAHLLRKIAE